MPELHSSTAIAQNSLAFNFSGRRVLLTGASRGIAATLAQALGRAGADLVIHYSLDADTAAGFPNAARELVETISISGINVELIEIDLAQPGSGRALARASLSGGPVDSVVLSASRQIHRPLMFQTPEDIDAQLRINLYANIEIIQGLLPQMAAMEFGRVLSIGSVQETAPSAEMPIYAACKAALRNLVEGLALQAGSRGITVNNIAPGLIATDRNAFRRADKNHWQSVSARSSAVGRAGTPDDMVGPALMLLAREAGYVSGATVHVTGASHITRNSPDGSYPTLQLPEVTNRPASGSND